jgi:CRISPR type IV-associated protein Csf3
MKPLKITFELDGTGMISYPNDPIMLDGLLAYAAMPAKYFNYNIDKQEKPYEPELPLKSIIINDQKIWCASALFVEGQEVESIQYWRKKFRTSRAVFTKGTVNLQSGTYREYNVPMPLMLNNRLTAYAYGNESEIERLLDKIKYIGHKRAYGKGRINNIIVNEIDIDYSVVKGNTAMKYIPNENGDRIGRVRPPYWSEYETCQSCFVGDDIEL